MFPREEKIFSPRDTCKCLPVEAIGSHAQMLTCYLLPPFFLYVIITTEVAIPSCLPMTAISPKGLIIQNPGLGGIEARDNSLWIRKKVVPLHRDFEKSRRIEILLFNPLKPYYL